MFRNVIFNKNVYCLEYGIGEIGKFIIVLLCSCFKLDRFIKIIIVIHVKSDYIIIGKSENMTEILTGLFAELTKILLDLLFDANGVDNNDHDFKTEKKILKVIFGFLVIMGIAMIFCGKYLISLVFCTITVVILSILLFVYRKLYRQSHVELWEKYNELEKKKAELVECEKTLKVNDEELQEKDKELKKINVKLMEREEALKAKDIELTEKEEILKAKNLELTKMQNDIAVWKGIFDSKIRKEIGFYLRNREYFHSFKTKLILSNCKLEACLVKEDNGKRKLQFEWTLTVLKPSSDSENVARFIFSDDDGGHRVTPKVIVNDHREQPTRTKQDDIKGSYCFLEIPLGNAFSSKSTATINISYKFSAYEFKQEEDVIWLIPGTLGFDDVEEFHICLLCDDEIIKDTTHVRLITYTLEGGYKEMGDDTIECEKSDKNVKYFQCKKQKLDNLDLRKFGYMLELKNEEKKEDLVDNKLEKIL